MMSVEKGYFYTDASCLVTEYCKHGSVLVGTHTEYHINDWEGAHSPNIKYRGGGGHGTHSPSIKYGGDTHSPSIKYGGYTHSPCTGIKY